MEENFFQRWARRKAEQSEGGAAQSNRSTSTEQTEEMSSLPTWQDVEALNAQSDYSAFLAQGVDKSVQRAAMKKLFSDPHFNTMDGLDIYIGDYTKAVALPAGMLAALQHTQKLFAPTPAPTTYAADADNIYLDSLSEEVDTSQVMTESADASSLDVEHSEVQSSEVPDDEDSATPPQQTLPSGSS